MNITAKLSIQSAVAEVIGNQYGSGSLNVPLNYTMSLLAGTGAGNADLYFPYTETLAISTPRTWTLSALTDAIGRAVAFTKIRLAIVANLSQIDADFLMLGNAGTHPWAAPFGSATDRVKVPAGGIHIFAAPLLTAFAVGSGSSDQFMIDPGALAIPYSMLLVGE